MVMVLISRMARPSSSAHGSNSPSAGRPLVTLLMMLLMVLGGPLMVPSAGSSPSAGRPLVTLLMMLLMVLGGVGTWTQEWVGPCTNRTVCGVTPWELESASTAEATSSRGGPSATPVAHLPNHRPCGALLTVAASRGGRLAPPLLMMVTLLTSFWLRFAKETS